MIKSDTLDLNLSKSLYYIKFYPGIKSSIGCEKATLILGRLEYWFEKYKNGFYKFVEPCHHPLYREGDSWHEEIGFSRKIFAKAFDLVGVRYKSKSAFMKAGDRFKGKLYASYHDRKTNQTYFVRNHGFASQFIKGLFNKKPTTKTQKLPQSTQEDCSPKIRQSSFPNGRSRSGQNCRSSGGTIGGKENKPIQRNTSSLSEDPSTSSSVHSKPLQKKVTEDMIKIWEEEVGELGFSSISAGFLNRLFDSFRKFFEQSLDSWKVYCRMIASSKFLMGEAQNKFFKKAWITWAIKEETIERINNGEFQLGDRQTNQDKKFGKLKAEIKNMENKKSAIEEKIKTIKELVCKERKTKIKEKILKLSEEENKTYQLKFKKYLEEENNSMTEEFKRFGWQGRFISSYFEAFVEEKVEKILFNFSQQEEVHERKKTSGFLESLEDICKNLQQLKEKMHVFNEHKETTGL